jgi:hypothetical protein
MRGDDNRSAEEDTTVGLTSRLTALLLAAFPVAFPLEGDPIPRSIATDPTYGLTSTNPVRVGGTVDGLAAEEAYLAALRSPTGEPVTFRYRNSCCAFPTSNAWFGTEALLDAYDVRYPGLRKPIVVYLNKFEWQEPRAPVGFTLERERPQ